jgi:hypothetical protein
LPLFWRDGYKSGGLRKKPVGTPNLKPDRRNPMATAKKKAAPKKAKKAAPKKKVVKKAAKKR